MRISLSRETNDCVSYAKLLTSVQERVGGGERLAAVLQALYLRTEETNCEKVGRLRDEVITSYFKKNHNPENFKSNLECSGSNDASAAVRAILGGRLHTLFQSFLFFRAYNEYSKKAQKLQNKEMDFKNGIFRLALEEVLRDFQLEVADEVLSSIQVLFDLPLLSEDGLLVPGVTLKKKEPKGKVNCCIRLIPDLFLSLKLVNFDVAVVKHEILHCFDYLGILPCGSSWLIPGASAISEIQFQRSKPRESRSTVSSQIFWSVVYKNALDPANFGVLVWELSNGGGIKEILETLSKLSSNKTEPNWTRVAGRNMAAILLALEDEFGIPAEQALGRILKGEKVEKIYVPAR